MIRVAIVASSAIVRAGLESMALSGGGVEIVTSAATLADVHADVALVQSEEVPDLTGWPPTILLVDPAGTASILELLRSGARAVLPAQANANEISGALLAIAAGLIVIHPHDLEDVFPATQRAVDSGVLDSARLDSLSPREVEVLGMIAEGLSNKTIAWQMQISEHTVKFHVGSIMTKLNAGSRTEAVTRGLRQGLIYL